MEARHNLIQIFWGDKRHVQQFTPWYSVWDATIDVDKAPNNRWARKFEIFWCEITSLLGLGKIAAKLLLWTHFKPMLHFYIPWKHEKTSGFLMFQGIKNEHWLEIDLFWCACVSFFIKLNVSKWLEHNTFRSVDQTEKLLSTSSFRTVIKNKISEQSLDELLHQQFPTLSEHQMSSTKMVFLQKWMVWPTFS